MVKNIKVLSQYLSEVEREIENLIAKHNQISRTSYLIGFRGENEDYGKTSLMPSLFRGEDYVGKEKYLFELLRDYGFLSSDKNRNVDSAIEALHYIAISRMLDISFSLLPAMYFACHGGKIEKDGFVYIFCFPEYYSPHSQYIEDFYKNILEDKKICIKSEDKSNLLKELNQVFQINEASLFPEKGTVASIVKEKFEEKEYRIKNIDIESEINICFERVEYEIKALKLNENKENPMRLLRKIRKEESDLLYYIHKNIKQGEVENKRKEFEQKIEKNFKLMRMEYCM